MLIMENTITIEEAVRRALNTERTAIEKIKNLDERSFYVGFLENPNLIYACNSIFKEANYLNARNHFYTCAALKEYIHLYYKESVFTTHRSFCYALLSDNSKIINRYLQYKDDFFQTFGVSFAKALQACIENDDTKLADQINLLEKYVSRKTWEKNYVGSVNSFRGILLRDKSLTEQGINEFLKKHNRQDHPVIVKDFLNIEALTLAKLAYRKGIEVDIKNKLVPKEMIVTKELEKYTTYDFLE